MRFKRIKVFLKAPLILNFRRTLQPNNSFKASLKQYKINKAYLPLLVDVVYQQSKLVTWVHESSGDACSYRKENLTLKNLI